MPSEGLPSPSEVFISSVAGEVNKEDVYKMVEEQQHMMGRFEKTNEMLLNFNMLSAARFEATHHEFKQHTKLLTDMKKDLDSIFRRVRVLKTKLSKQHPDAFKACSDVFGAVDEEEEEEGSDEAATSPEATTAAPVITTTSASPDKPENSAPPAVSDADALSEDAAPATSEHSPTETDRVVPKSASAQIDGDPDDKQ